MSVIGTGNHEWVHRPSVDEEQLPSTADDGEHDHRQQLQQSEDV